MAIDPISAFPLALGIPPPTPQIELNPQAPLTLPPAQPAFGGPLLPGRGRLANFLFAGLLGAAAGGQASNLGAALGAGAMAPFQFQASEAERRRREEIQQFESGVKTRELEFEQQRLDLMRAQEARQGKLTESQIQAANSANTMHLSQNQLFQLQIKDWDDTKALDELAFLVDKLHYRQVAEATPDTVNETLAQLKESGRFLGPLTSVVARGKVFILEGQRLPGTVGDYNKGQDLNRVYKMTDGSELKINIPASTPLDSEQGNMADFIFKAEIDRFTKERLAEQLGTIQARRQGLQERDPLDQIFDTQVRVFAKSATGQTTALVDILRTKTNFENFLQANPAFDTPEVRDKFNKYLQQEQSLQKGITEQIGPGRTAADIAAQQGSLLQTPPTTPAPPPPPAPQLTPALERFIQTLPGQTAPVPQTAAPLSTPQPGAKSFTFTITPGPGVPLGRLSEMRDALLQAVGGDISKLNVDPQQGLMTFNAADLPPQELAVFKKSLEQAGFIVRIDEVQ